MKFKIISLPPFYTEDELKEHPELRDAPQNTMLHGYGFGKNSFEAFMWLAKMDQKFAMNFQINRDYKDSCEYFWWNRRLVAIEENMDRW